MKIAVLFPGQGSQFLGMGREFIEQDSDCREMMRLGEEACGLPLEALINDGPMEELTRNAKLQPAITVTNLICWTALKKLLGDVKVSCFAGHSLGEYSALCAAGVLSPTDTLRLVAKRGALMEREGAANPGGMRAVVGLSIEAVEDVLASYDGSGVVTAANHNTPEQIVISGSMDALDAVSPLAEAKGAKVIPLNVSVANHSPLVANAVPEFSSFMNSIEFKVPGAPVYFNVSAAVSSDPDQIRDMMGRQIASRVRWCEIITAMINDGVDTFIEVGPKTVLKGMMRKIKPKGVEITALQFDTPDALAGCLEKLSIS
ncbi:ACP S-malonyltransferase [Desulfopila aestuarii]|uniref:Malonyl CoA-acyl carrier protein transacylase n=1 Tax=Desulfopila aestuarii DSM 18488 TaxID=1121416 RepID=A0A1M7Y1N5_9BACT|nr:ACP S-malonyltransferase [Desulfopila aestuarii]SHO45552.1 [acyl-carrier-protein] S-malonyltransferase [Desulfopila aestuarii DSM 18488]